MMGRVVGLYVLEKVPMSPDDLQYGHILIFPWRLRMASGQPFLIHGPARWVGTNHRFLIPSIGSDAIFYLIPCGYLALMEFMMELLR